MSKIVWDQTGEKFYETGIRNAVLYVQASNLYPLGVAWNGLVSVSESPSGAEPTPLYADDIKYLNMMSVEEFGATIEAYTYPDAFGVCDGSAELSVGVSIGQQVRKPFGLAYRTVLGNDVSGNDLGYKIHLIYGALAAPSEKAYASINDSPEAITFSWALTTTPVEVTGKKPTASLVIDSTKVDSAKLAALELILYGTTGVDPRLPLPSEIETLFTEAAPSALSLTTIVPAHNATDINVAANVVITFNNKIASEDVIITKADGTLVTSVNTWDVTGKILTMNPASDLTAGTIYYVTIINVVDIYSQTLATVVKIFTTAA